MFSILIVSQGGLAQELAAAGSRISGDAAAFEALSLSWEDNLETARRKLGEAVDRLAVRDGLLILIDMFGSTPCNAAASFLAPGRVEMVTGVNLPMVVRLGCLAEKVSRVDEAAEWLKGKGRASICHPDLNPAGAGPAYVANDAQDEPCG